LMRKSRCLLCHSRRRSRVRLQHEDRPIAGCSNRL
jgi:hypothetical protein